jgi:hypothetical protein
VLGVHSHSLCQQFDCKFNPAKRTDGSPVGFAFAFKPRNQANAKVADARLRQENEAGQGGDSWEVLRATEEFAAQSVEKKAN